MKERVFFISKIVSFIIVLFIIFNSLQIVFSPEIEHNNERIAEFYSLPEGSLDILFLGQSEMYCGINTKMMYEDYGVSAFSLGGAGQWLRTTEYCFIEALKYQKPKYVFFEYSDFQRNKPVINTIETQYAWNYMYYRPSYEKVQALNDIGYNYKTAIINGVFPLIKWHTRWSQLEKKSFLKLLPNDYTSRGFYPFYETKKVNLKYNEPYGSVKSELYITDEKKKIIYNIDKICKENNIQLLFIRVPCAEWTKECAYYTEQYLKENNYKYYDLNNHYEEIGIDPNTDFFNNYHMNINGANKTTKYIYENIIKNLDL